MQLSAGERRRVNKKRRREKARASVPVLKPTATEDVEDSDEVSLPDSKRPKHDVESEAHSALEDASKRDGTLSDWLNPAHRHHWKALKTAWPSIPRKRRTALVELDRARCQEAVVAVKHPFHATPDDHCETAPEAHADIAPVLHKLAKRVGKPDSELSIYDPYFCAGTAVRNLKELGFETVRNVCEDFYARLATSGAPDHDVLVTNPPYSGDHLDRLFEFVLGANAERPALLLVPSFVLSKPYFTARASEFVFVAPRRRYVYWTPKGLRPRDGAHNHVSARGIRTSPFVSLWLLRNCGAASDIAELFAGNEDQDGGAVFAATVKDLPRALQPAAMP